MKTRQTILRTALIMGLLSLALPACAETSNPSTDWFSQAKLGVFMHFLPSPQSGPRQVEQFDAKALADQLADMGAGYFVLTLGQNSGWFNSPNAAYDKRTGYAPGERCSKRDLPLELYPALKAKGIRLMLYLPCQVPNQNRRAQKAYGLAEGPKNQPLDLAFAAKWSEVIQEWSDRYGDQVAGWWFDGGYAHIGFRRTARRDGGCWRRRWRRGGRRGVCGHRLSQCGSRSDAGAETSDQPHP